MSEIPLQMGTNSISIKSAERLSTVVNTKPQIPSVTPRWLLKILPWVHVDSGIYRINRIKTHFDTAKSIVIEHGKHGEPRLTMANLKRFYFFRNLDEETLKKIGPMFEPKECEVGEEIVKEGETGDNFYIILMGNFEVSIRNKYGQKIILANLKEGDYFGEMALLQDVPRQATVEAKSYGIVYYLNRPSFEKVIENPQIKESFKTAIKERKQILASATQFGEKKLPINVAHFGDAVLQSTFIEYDENPPEVHLSMIQTVIGINTCISDIYNTPHIQLEEQIRVAMEMLLEREEWELINNKEFGLLHNARPQEVIITRHGAPTPDDLDNLIAIVWKKPSFFLAHPRAIAAFGRECTKRGLPSSSIEMLGATFMTWRGIPLIPTEKLEVNEDLDSPGYATTSIILLRVGEADQGVIGLYKNNLPGQITAGINVQFMGIDNHSTANHLLTNYFSLAILVPDAIAILQQVEVGNYYDS